MSNLEVPPSSRLALESVIMHAKAKKTRVAAEITLEDGASFCGCNVESSCHTLSICAERAAVVAWDYPSGPPYPHKNRVGAGVAGGLLV